MKNIKAIFIDLDGTLVGHEGIVAQESVDILHELIEKGIKVVISTGRNYIQAKKITKNIKGLWYITNNGAYVVDDNHILLFSKPLEQSKFLKFVDEALEFKGLDIFVQNHEKIVTNSTTWGRFKTAFSKDFFKKISISNIRAFFHREASVGREIKHIENPRDFFVNTKENWLKALVTGNLTAVKYLAEKYKDEYSISFSHSDNIEVNAKGVSKGDAIKTLCEMLNIDLADTMCFGDSGNDIEMFKVVGIPVVMENSEVEELGKLAKYRAKNYDELGVYHFLKEHF